MIHSPEHGPHLTDEELQAYDRLELPPQRRSELDAALAGCPFCLERLDALSGEGAETPPPVDATPPPEPEQPEWLPPERVGDFVVLEVLGRGGMGVVYKARDERLRRLVAIKFVSAGAAGERRARLLDEARHAATVDHANVVKVFASGLQGETLYVVMELVGGGTMAEKLAASRGLPPREVAELVAKVARGLAAAHAAGLVHRDVKPSNVLLRPGGEPVLGDFGLARRTDLPADATRDTRAGQFLGTAAYSSPEQIQQAKDVGPASDVYSLGATLYEALTGQVPFVGSAHEMISAHLGEEPVPPRRIRPGLPLDLDTICLKCLEKAQSRRYAGAAELADDLERYLRGEPIVARPVSRAERLARWCARNPRTSSLAGALAASLLALVVSLTVFLAIASKQRNDLAKSESETKTALRDAEQTLRLATTNAADTAGMAESMRLLPAPQGDRILEVLEKAEADFGRLEEKGAPAREVRRGKAVIWNSRAAVLLSLGRHADAIAYADRAYGGYDELAGEEPEEAEWAAGKATARTRRGAALFREGDLVKAKAAHEEAEGLRAGLLAKHGGHAERAEWLAGRAGNLQGIAEVHSAEGDDWRASERYRRALTYAEEAFALDGDRETVRHRLASCLLRVGESLSNKSPEESVGHFRRGLGLTTDHARKAAKGGAKRNGDLLQVHSDLFASIGFYHKGRGEFDLARENFKQATDLAVRISAMNPADPLWAIQECNCRFVLADVPGKRSRREEWLELKKTLDENAKRFDALPDATRRLPLIRSQIANLNLNRASVYVGLSSGKGTSEAEAKELTAAADGMVREATKESNALNEQFPGRIAYLRTLHRAKFTAEILAFAKGEKQPGMNAVRTPALANYYAKQLAAEKDNPSWQLGAARDGKPEDAASVYSALLEKQPYDLELLSLRAGALQDAANKLPPDDPKRVAHSGEIVVIRKRMLRLDRTNRNRWRELDGALTWYADVLYHANDRVASDRAAEDAWAHRILMTHALPGEASRDPFLGDAGGESQTGAALTAPFSRFTTPLGDRARRLIYEQAKIHDGAPTNRRYFHDLDWLDRGLDAIRTLRDETPGDAKREWFLARTALHQLARAKSDPSRLPPPPVTFAAFERRVNQQVPASWEPLSTESRSALVRMDYATFVKQTAVKDRWLTLALLDEDVREAKRLSKDDYEFCRYAIAAALTRDREALQMAHAALTATAKRWPELSPPGRELLSLLARLSGDNGTALSLTSPSNREPIGEGATTVLQMFMNAELVQSLKVRDLTVPTVLIGAAAGDKSGLIGTLATIHVTLETPVAVSIAATEQEIESQCRRGNFRAAAAEINALMKPAPGNPGFRHLIAGYHYYNRDFAKAELLLNNLPPLPASTLLDARILLARTQFERGKVKDAMKLAEQLVEEHPKYYPARVALVGLKGRLGKVSIPDVEDMATLARQHPGDLDLAIVRALQQLALGQPDVALMFLEDFAKDERLRANPEYYFVLARAYHGLSRIGDTRLALVRGLRAFPPGTQKDDRLRQEMREFQSKLDGE